MKRRTKKILTAMLIVTVVVGSMFVPATKASAATKTESINTAIKTVFKAVKKTDFVSVYKRSVKTEIGAKVTKQTLTSQKESLKFLKAVTPKTYSYMKSCNEKMTYKVISKKAKGKNATVKVKVTYVDQTALAAKVQAIAANVDLAAQMEGMDLEEGLNFMFKAMDDMIGQAAQELTVTSYKTVTFTIKFVKDGKKWKMKKLPKKLVNIMQAGLSEGETISLT